MQIQDDVKPILTSLQAGKLANWEIKKLIFICRSIAESALRTYHKRTAVLLSSHGWSLHDLSIDCIAELFASDSEGKLIKFESLLKNPIITFSSNYESIEQLPNHQCFLALKGYVNSFVSYRLMKILSEVDPEGRRISRNIREAVQTKRVKIQISRDFRGEVLIFNQDDSNENLPEFPTRELEEGIFTKINKAGSMTEILEHIGTILSSQKCYRQSVRFIDVVQIIKRLYANLFFLEKAERDSEQQFNFESVDESDLESLRKSVVRFIAEKINTTYFQKNKVDKSEAMGLLSTISSLLDDWLKGEDTGHNYFKFAANELDCTEEEYKERWASIIHYLVKMMRTYIKEQLEMM